MQNFLKPSQLIALKKNASYLMLSAAYALYIRYTIVVERREDNNNNGVKMSKKERQSSIKGAMRAIINNMGWDGAHYVVQKLLEESEWSVAFDQVIPDYEVIQFNVQGWIVGDTPRGTQWNCWLKEGETFKSTSFLKRFSTMKINLVQHWTSHEMKKNTITLCIR